MLIVRDEIGAALERKGLKRNIDFKVRYEWPVKSTDLRLTAEAGWQDRSDPRFFPCCCRT
jgi:hypothetical protein